MRRNNKALVVILAVFVLLLALYFIFIYDAKRYNWSENYRVDGKQPYDLHILVTLLEDYFPGHDFTRMKKQPHSYLEANEGPANYIFIGNRIYLDSNSRETLLEFVAEGNSAFIASRSLPSEILRRIYGTEEDTGYTDYPINITYDTDSSYTEYEETADTYYEEVDTAYEEDDTYYETADTFVYTPDTLYADSYETTETYYYYDPARNHHYRSDSIASLNFSHPELRSEKNYDYTYRYRDKNTKARWEYTDSAAIRSYFEDAVILGTYDSTYINFIRIPYGEGHFYIHNNPRVFTNFYLIDAHKLDYAEKALGHLREGTIYFDDFSTVNYRNNNSGYGFSDSPLQFILSQQSLRWAWYLLLILALLYLLFRAKRKQRVIPVLEPNTNTSLEFTKTIGNLYYQQKDHSKLAQQKMKLFLAHVRMHYRIPTHEINEQLIRQIRLKSELPEKAIKDIFEHYEKIEASEETISSETLIRFHSLIDYFYNNCK